MLATLYRISGLSYDLDSLVHAVSGAQGMVRGIVHKLCSRGAFILTIVLIMKCELTNCDTPVNSVGAQTLKVEQLLTSGGGWQDQCGGLYPGAKLSESPKSDQLHVTTRVIGASLSHTNSIYSHQLVTCYYSTNTDTHMVEYNLSAVACFALLPSFIPLSPVQMSLMGLLTS